MTEARLTHIGGPTTLLEVGGWRLLTDPTFDPPGRRYDFGWGTSSRKLTGPALSPDELGPIDAVLLTHDHHGDNLDGLGRSFLAGVPRILTTQSGARRLGAEGLAFWETVVLSSPGRSDISVTATPCRHGPPLTRPIVGDVIGFALRWDGQEHGALWFTGDTVLYSEVLSVPARIPIGTVVLHLGGVRFPLTGPLRYTMTADRAVRLLSTFSPHTVIPVHYEGWAHFAEGSSTMDATFAAAPASVRERVRRIPIGEPVTIAV